MGVGDKEVVWGGGKRTVEGEKKGGGGESIKPVHYITVFCCQAIKSGLGKS